MLEPSTGSSSSSSSTTLVGSSVEVTMAHERKEIIEIDTANFVAHSLLHLIKTHGSKSYYHLHNRHDRVRQILKKLITMYLSLVELTPTTRIQQLFLFSNIT